MLIRDAQRARLRELVLMLEEIEPGFCFDDDARIIAGVPPRSLVLLALRREQLDWLNLNRPLFAERSLRAVLWAEADLAVELKFRAPDLHDWVSHFATCPPGVPDFAVDRLARAVRSRPGVAWLGPGLELALPRVPDLGDCLELDPAWDSSLLVQALERADHQCIIWKNVKRHTRESRILSAITKTGFEGVNILDNPSIPTPGWSRVSSQQLELRDAVARLSGDRRYHAAALVEIEPRAIGADADTAAKLDEPRLAGSALEHSVVLTMLGRYEAALARFEAAPTTDSYYPSFERFHQLTRAALGQMQLPDLDQSPLSSRVELQGRALLRIRLAHFDQP